jgi:hypothetical protein
MKFGSAGLYLAILSLALHVSLRARLTILNASEAKPKIR